MTEVSSSENEQVVDLWEQKLELMGVTASQDQLVAHLSCAPIDAPSREFLSGYVAAIVRS